MRRRLILALAGIALATGAGVAWLRVAQPTAEDTIVNRLFARQYIDAGGNEIDLNTYRGSVLVVNFWATWCAPCIEEMPELSELQVEMTSKGVQVLGMGIDTSARIQEFTKKVKVLYPLLVLDSAGLDLMRAFGNQTGGLPFTLVIDRKGQIVDRRPGRIDKARLRRVILRTAQE